MFEKLFKSFYAVALLLATTIGFVACEEDQTEVADPTVEVSTKALTFTNEEGSETVDITANAGWKIVVDYTTGSDWVVVTPEAGNGDAKILVSVPMNDTGAIREAVIKVIALHPTYGNWDTKRITVSQSASEQPPVVSEMLYYDNFDGKEATKTYGSGSSWPYIDQFPEFANPEGPAAENVTYSGTGVSVRANSTSNSNYSDYAGSGLNNIFFGANAYFQINDIALEPEQNTLQLTFGSEKYTQDGDSTFNTDEFKAFISKNGTAWVQVDFDFAGTEPGRWNVATANFTLTEVPETLYIKYTASVASVYRLDDVKLSTGNGGQEILLPEQGEEPEPPTPPTTDALYYENFDGKVAQKEGSYWPYVSDFPDMKNAAGPAAVNVSYDGQNVTVRSNSTSDGTYSDYAGSGLNNIFFGKEAHFLINNLKLETDQKNLQLTFGTEKYSQDNGSKFTESEFIVSLSNDGQTWTSIDYDFAGTAEGRWNVATANFTLKESTSKLYIKFAATVASSYRLDDVTLNVGEGGQEIDLGKGGEEPEPDPDPVVPAEGIYASDAPFVCDVDDSANAVYGLGDTSINGNAVTGFKLGTSKKAGYCKSSAVGVAGDKYLNLYAVAWKGKSATLYFRVDGGAAQSLTLAANDGATSNPPYTALTFADSDHYSVLLSGLKETSTIEFSTDESFASVDNDASGRAIVCGVKLTDEPLGTEGGGGDEPDPTPDPTPDGITPIATILAKGVGTTIDNAVIEAVVISNMDLNNLTSKKGLYVQDETAGLQFYLAANHEFKRGDKLKIDLSGAEIGQYNEAIQISGLALDKISVVSSGNAVVAKSVTIADFLANKYEGQYVAIEGVQVADADLSKTWVMGGSHTSIKIEDANGKSFVVFSSKYATYGSTTVAQGSGTIKGIAGYNKGTVQIIFSSNDDYAGLTGARFSEGGETPDPDPTPDGVVKATIAEFLAAAEDDTVYELTGTIANVVANKTYYGNFDIVDETGSVYVYGIVGDNGERVFESLGLKNGDIVTLRGTRQSFNGSPQMKDALYVSHVEGEPEPEPELPDGAVMAKITFSEQGYANGESVDGVKISLDENVSVVFRQGSANNAPAYYDSGSAIRMYQNGATLDVNANGKTITNIELGFSNSMYYVAANCGTLSEEALVRTWTGEATDVKFTSTGTDKSHRAYVAYLKVTYLN